MNSSIPMVFDPRQLRRTTWVLAALWTLAVAASMVWSAHLLRDAMMEAATTDARSNCDKDVLFRKWAMLQGSIYVPVTATTPSNPNLSNLVERDLVTPSGQRLTLMNMDYLTRQMQELETQELGTHGRITSLKPLRPANAPDAWEAAALRAFEQGRTEVSSRELMHGQPHLRLMKPLVTEAGCLKCHAVQGYHPGEICGGLSIAVPLAPYQALAQTRIRPIAGIHAGVWALGLLGIFLGGRQMRQRLDQQVQAETVLVETSALLATFLQNTTDGIYFKDLQSRFVHFSERMLEFFKLTHPDELKGRTDFDFFFEEHARPAFEAEQEIIRMGKPILNLEEKETHRDGRVTWVLTSKTPWRDRTGTVIGTFGISKDITPIKEAQAQLEQLHKQLLETSRRGGMAEIATNVLHNVGNVLNSVNISTGLIVENVKQSKASSLARVVVLLQEHAPDLGAFITQDSRGKHLPAHLAQLAEQLRAEREASLRELESLRRNVEHIKEIVAMQQNYATFGGVKEMLNVVTLVEDSLRINEGALGRHQVEVIREFEPVPPMNVEKHKILQILVNLLRNAKHACQDSERADKRLTVRVAHGEGRIQISVMDNGIGIPPENLTRIFNYGFTTRQGGHGFGLHSCALAAQEMDGSLTVQSAGAGQGATFTLELPLPAAGELP